MIDIDRIICATSGDAAKPVLQIFTQFVEGRGLFMVFDHESLNIEACFIKTFCNISDICGVIRIIVGGISVIHYENLLI